jgi:hypothetical protein
MATQIITTQKSAYFDCGPEEATARFTGKQLNGQFVRRPGDPGLAWEHGECMMRTVEIDRVPRVRTPDGRVGVILTEAYDLTRERYDRYYNAWVDFGDGNPYPPSFSIDDLKYLTES